MSKVALCLADFFVFLFLLLLIYFIFVFPVMYFTPDLYQWLEVHRNNLRSLNLIPLILAIIGTKYFHVHFTRQILIQGAINLLVLVAALWQLVKLVIDFITPFAVLYLLYVFFIK
jgi:hypothetical protein